MFFLLNLIFFRNLLTKIVLSIIHQILSTFYAKLANQKQCIFLIKFSNKGVHHLLSHQQALSQLVQLRQQLHLRVIIRQHGMLIHWAAQY